VECPNDINGMIDAAKYADLALLLIDGSYGFEMVSSRLKLQACEYGLYPRNRVT
jgi:hypothetical protein